MANKEFWKRLTNTFKDKLMGGLVTMIVIMTCAFVGFAWQTYQAINSTVPALKDTVEEMVKVVDSLDKSPIEITREIKIIKNSQDLQGKEIDDMTKKVEHMQATQEAQEKSRQEDYRETMKILLQIKNGY